MYIALIILHVILCLVLIVTILLQAGKGGGLTEMFGGDTAQSVLGTQAPLLLKKITEISAVGFIVTSLALGMVTARRGQSLFDSSQLPFLPSEQAAEMPVVPEQSGQDSADMAEMPPLEPLDIPGDTNVPVVDSEKVTAEIAEVDVNEAIANVQEIDVEDMIVEAPVAGENVNTAQEEGGR